jgi:hypothetical protein
MLLYFLNFYEPLKNGIISLYLIKHFQKKLTKIMIFLKKKLLLCFSLLFFILSTGSVFADDVIFPPATKCTSIEQCLTMFMENLRYIIPVLALIFIILGGILYITSYGSEKRITRAKLCITSAIIGLAITLAAPSFLLEIKKIFGIDTGDSHALTLLEISSNVLSFLLSIIGILAIISLVVGGMMYMTSFGDTKKVETGKLIVKNSIIGIIVALSSLVIVNEIARLIQVN